MNRLLNAWKPLLLGLVLVAVLVGVAGAVRTDQPSALSSQRKLVISAAEFNPIDNTSHYNNNGIELFTLENITELIFIAPVDFPTYQPVTVDKVQLHAYDNNVSEEVRIWLYRTKPSAGTEGPMAFVETGWTFAEDAVRTWEDTSVNANPKMTAYDTYLQARISDDTNLRIYGATIYYRVGS